MATRASSEPEPNLTLATPAIGGNADGHDREVMLPACFSTALVVDRNRARQLLVPEQAVDLPDADAEAATVALASDEACRIVPSRLQPGDAHRALVVPKKVPLTAGLDLRGVPGVRWTGNLTPSTPTAVLDSLKHAFAFREDKPEEDIRGLRLPQLGAVHAVLGYWTTDPKEPATIVMPTGTGKTETMVALFAQQRIERLLVIVPSDALRGQVAGKFETFGVLQEFGVVASQALRPVVGQLRHGFATAAAAEEFAHGTNVVVATPNALNASVPEARAAFVAGFSHLFVDEAHHVAAATWRSIRDDFAGKPVVQFTATPFREDGRHLGGRLLYAFPLREAQRQGYFSTIDYVSVVEFEDPDGAIATEAVGRLRADLGAGYDHLLMARAHRIGRANDLLARYQQLAPDLNPVLIHSNSPAGVRREALASVHARESRIVVCVDMLGEGFDLPALKIAAIHDAHKSLGVTLQFVGRFARASGTGLGGATVVVGRPELDYDEKLRRLYAEDADWNLIIRDLSEMAVGDEQEVSEFEEAFGPLPDEVSLRNLLPKMSTVVYRTDASEWDPNGAVALFGEDGLLTLPIAINERDRVSWFVTENRGEVRWGEVPTLEEVGYDLYVLYWDEARGLLYINSSNTDSFHEELAKRVCGDSASRIIGEEVYRVMAHVSRLVPTNVGVVDIRNRARRFSMFVGADVTEGFPTAEAQTKTKTNIFAYGFENGARVSIGASLKGRVWSYRVAPSLKHWVDWCEGVGTKLIDGTINIDAVMQSFIRPKAIEERPPLVVLSAEWPWEVFLSTSEESRLERGGSEWPIVDADLEITSRETDGPITFDVVTPDWRVPYEATFSSGNIVYSPKAGDVTLLSRRSSQSLSSYLNKHGLLFHLEQDATIVHPGMLLRPDRELPPFEPAKILALDWVGIDLRKESQGPNRDADSIQARTIEYLLGQADWDLVIDDDGPGEIADVVAISADDEELHVTLVHCKYSSASTAGARVADLYELCGQAQKSARWRRSVDHMFRQLLRRERKRSQQGRSGLVTGDITALYGLQEKARMLRPRFTIAIAQPGLSKTVVSAAQLELLASSELYLHETALATFSVYANT
jgi:superfamily II DNA or RNA helicase